MLQVCKLSGIPKRDGRAASDGIDVPGSELASESGLNSSLSVGENIWVVAAILVDVRVLSFIGLHMSYRLNWM